MRSWHLVVEFNPDLRSIRQRSAVLTSTEADHRCPLSSDNFLDKLAKLSGAGFDKEYLSAMVKDHEDDVKANRRKVTTLK